MGAQVTGFRPSSFLQAQTSRLRELSDGKKALAAISGGVDSTISALLARQALGERVIPVLIDTGFMREDEPEKVRDKLASPPLELKIRIVRSAGRFLKAVADESLAEEKRKKFRETFYQVLKEESDKFGCEYLVQGTIAPDWIETQGGIKTQHNVLEQVGINPRARYGFKLLEPLSELYKDQVRSLAKYLAVPNEFSERQPFPGPGLLVRCIGEVKKSKLETLKRATSIVEDRLGAVGSNQYFAAIIENKFADEPSPKALRKVAADALDLPEDEVRAEAFLDRVTGVKGDERAYGRLASISLRNETREAFGWLHDKLNILQSSIVVSFKDITRVAVLVKDRRGEGQYSIMIRAVSTRDYMTASVTPISWKTLKDTAEEVLKSSERIGRVYYDITPKPPATIEFE
ncbi:GMP synthase [Candidatus Bathyarchaeota archaeon]|nr:MAG: GMP synthase [Candidatus Bathyarchaeota archaeon]